MTLIKGLGYLREKPFYSQEIHYKERICGCIEKEEVAALLMTIVGTCETGTNLSYTMTLPKIKVIYEAYFLYGIETEFTMHILQVKRYSLTMISQTCLFLPDWLHKWKPALS